MYRIGLDGRLIEPGNRKRVHEQFFTFGDALPSWLSVPEGTGSSIAHSASSNGVYRVLTGATAGSAAQLRTSDIYPARYSAIMFELLGLTIGGPSDVDIAADMFFQMRSTSGTPSGFDFHQRAVGPAEANLVSEIAGVTAPKQVRYTLRTQAEAYKRRDIGMLWLIEDQQIVFFEGRPESERASRVHASLSTASPVVPRFRMVTQEAVARSFSVSGVRLTLWER